MEQLGQTGVAATQITQASDISRKKLDPVQGSNRVLDCEMPSARAYLIVCTKAPVVVLYALI